MAKIKLTKKEAIKNTELFLEEMHKLEDEYGILLSSDEGDIYTQYLSSEENGWKSIEIGWDGDGSPLKVMEEIDHKSIGLSKLTEDEKEALGLL